jgi:hypothetical membrane protein
MLALGGVAGPVLFTTVVLTCAALRPGYSHYRDVISALGAAGSPNALFMNVGGFVATGLLLMGFGLSLSRLVPRTVLADAGSLFVVLFGAGMAGAGIFSCDCSATGTPREAFLHLVAAFVALPSGVVACAIWAIAFRLLPAGRVFSLFSLTSAALSAVLLLTQVGTGLSVPPGSGAEGLWQRLFLGTLFLWCGVVGLYVFRISAPEMRNA